MPFRDGIGPKARFTNEWPEGIGMAVHELRTELDRLRRSGRPHGMNAASNPVAGLDQRDVSAGASETRRRGESRHAGADHEHVAITHVRIPRGVEPALLVTKSDDRVEARRAAGGPETEEEPDQRAETERDGDGEG